MRRLHLFACLLLPVCARAATITYTETSIATGYFNGVAYNSALITLTGTGDSSLVSGSGGLYTMLLPVTVSVAGIGTGTFLDQIKVVDNQANSGVGFGDLTSNLAILFIQAPAFSSYDLQSTISATIGSTALNPGSAFSTTSGNFTISSASNGTFQATTTASVTPEPSSLALLGTGLGAVTGLVRRRFWRPTV